MHALTKSRHGIADGLTEVARRRSVAQSNANCFEAGRAVAVIDGENLRRGLSSDLGYTVEDRSENLRAARLLGSYAQ